jgi:hypothetical protein
MSIWIVRVSWNEDDTAATELWAVNTPTADEAVREASTHVRYPPHHVDVRPYDPDIDPPSALDVESGQVRLIPSL